MALSFHPQAIISFNSKADALVGLIREMPMSSGPVLSFPTEVQTVEITDSQIIGEVMESETDYMGNVVARFFRMEGKRYGLVQDDYIKLKELSSTIAVKPEVREKLGTRYVEEVLFQWVKSAFVQGNCEEKFSDALISQSNRDIKRLTLWVPVSNLEVEAPLQFGIAQLKSITSDVIDNWQSILPKEPDERNENAEKFFAETRKKYKGRAAVVVTSDAEPQRAFELAIEKAEIVTSMLALYSPGAFLADVKCITKISGSESIARATAFIDNPDGGFQSIEEVLDIASAKPWRLSKDDVLKMQSSGLDIICNLISDANPSNFKKAILNYLFIYSKAAFTNDPVEKIVYILSSLESVLLKNDNEPIQQNLGERIAYFLGHDLTKRKEIISNIKEIYGVRSRYLHHGHLRSEMKNVADFLQISWNFFMNLIANAKQFQTQLEFVSALDDKKLG